MSRAAWAGRTPGFGACLSENGSLFEEKPWRH